MKKLLVTFLGAFLFLCGQNASAQLNALHRLTARYAGSLSVHSGEQAESTVLLLEEGAQR